MHPSSSEPVDASPPGQSAQTRRARSRVIVGTVALAAVLGVTLGAVAVRGHAPVAEATVASGHDVIVEVESIDRDLVPFADALARLEDPQRAFVVTVLGDSTGNEKGEWVDRAFTALAEKLDRPLVEHPWNLQRARYGEPILANTEAPGAPIVVWNGSASGKTAAYSLEHYGTLVPEQPDVLFLNHGLNNVRHPELVAGEFSDVLTRTEQNWPNAVGYAALLENPRFDDWADAHSAVLSHVRGWLDERPFVLGIDVHSAYLERGDVAELLTVDMLHPSASGSQLTADTVVAALLDAAEDAGSSLAGASTPPAPAP